MATGNIWSRVRDDVRGLTERTRRGTRRAIERGVLRVDLVSLRRARSRALADLGGRTLAFWDKEQIGELDSDAEAVRLRARIAEVDARIHEKEGALARLRAESTQGRPDAANTEGTNGIT